MYLQKKLEAKQFVTENLVVPFTQDPRLGMEESYEELKQPQPTAIEDEVKARSIILPCVAALIADHVNRWGNRTNILTYRAGLRRQPQGLRPEQLMATVLDPRCMMLYGAENDERGTMWQMVVQRAALIAMEEWMTGNSTALSKTSPTVLSAASGSSAKENCGSATRCCGGFMTTSKAQVGKGSPGRAAVYL